MEAAKRGDDQMMEMGADNYATSLPLLGDNENDFDGGGGGHNRSILSSLSYNELSGYEEGGIITPEINPFVVIVLYSIIVLVSAVGNSLVIKVAFSDCRGLAGNAAANKLRFRRAPRTTTDRLIGSLALSDLIMTIFNGNCLILVIDDQFCHPFDISRTQFLSTSPASFCPTGLSGGCCASWCPSSKPCACTCRRSR